MATLPTAANVIGAVQPQSAPNVRVPRDAFPNYDAAADTIGKIGRTLGASFIRENIETEAQDLANQLNTFGRNLESGNATGDDYDADGNLAPPPEKKVERGFLNLFAREAMDERPAYEKRFEDERKRLEQSASNDAVRRLFRRTADTRQASFLDKVGSHFNTQRKAYRKTVNETAVNEARESAIADPDDPSHVEDVYNATFQYQRSIGADIKTAKSLAEEARTKTHSQVIADLVQRDPFKAEKYFEDKRAAGEIDSDALAGLREKIEGGVLRRKSQLKTDEIFKVPNQSPADRLKTARNITDDKLRDETVKRVKVRNDEEEAARKRDLRLRRDKVWKRIDRGEIDALSDIPSELRAGMSGIDIAAFERAIVNKEKATQGYGLTDDPDVMLEISDAEAAGDEEWANYNLNQHRGKLTRGTFNLIRQRQVRAINKDRDTIAKGPSYTLGHTLAKEALGAIGIKYGKAENKKNNANANRLFDSVREFVDDYFNANNGRLPKREEIEKHIARETLLVNFYGQLKGDLPRFLAVPTGEPFELENVDEPETQAQIATAIGYDQATVASIIAALQRANKR